MPLQLPGYNAPAVEMGSVLLNPGEVLYSPKGSIHYFVRETDVTDAFDVHVSGYAAEIVSVVPCVGRAGGAGVGLGKAQWGAGWGWVGDRRGQALQGVCVSHWSMVPGRVIAYVWWTKGVWCQDSARPTHGSLLTTCCLKQSPLRRSFQPLPPCLQVVGAFANYTGDPEELLYITGLYGGPTDITGQMVGLEDYRSARGPVATVDLAPELVRLQALFDAGEACFPESD